MTATHVNGVAVIASEPAEAPISTPEKPIHFKRIMKLLLEDGTEAFGCLHCDYAADSHMRVRPHLHKHTPRKAAETAPPPAAPEPIDPATITLAELLDAVQSSREHQADAERWKARALRAEQDLALIRRTLTGKAS